MGQRFQKGSLRKKGNIWVGVFWQDGQRRSRSLGFTADVTKSEAKRRLAAILQPLNQRRIDFDGRLPFRRFVEEVYHPVYFRKWKASTKATNEYRMKSLLMPAFERRSMAAITREELQEFLDKTAESQSRSVVDHLRWDLRAVFRLATSEGLLTRSPAELLFTPRAAHTGPRRVISFQEARTLLSLFEDRDRIILSLALVAGLRRGEIFGLQWGDVHPTHVVIARRVYRGVIDTPKTQQSERNAAISSDLSRRLEASRGGRTEGWVFPSQYLTSPMDPSNWWRRHVLPMLLPAGLEWVTLQVLRRTHSTLMRRLKIDPKLVAEQMGHTLDVNLNVYTQAGLDQRAEAVEKLATELLQ
jgi:integrase